MQYCQCYDLKCATTFDACHLEILRVGVSGFRGWVVPSMKHQNAPLCFPCMLPLYASPRCRWEIDAQYCTNLLANGQLRKEQAAAFVDVALLDMLIGNADRHHYETFSNASAALASLSPFILHLDNAKRLNHFPFLFIRSSFAVFDSFGIICNISLFIRELFPIFHSITESFVIFVRRHFQFLTLSNGVIFNF